MRVAQRFFIVAVLFTTAAACATGGGTDPVSPPPPPPPPPAYTIGGTLSGLSGSGLVLSNNGGNDLAIASGATSFAFPGSVGAGASYNVGIKTQPTGPAQTCVVTNPSGNVVSNVSVAVGCTTTSYTVGGTITGLTGSGLVLQNNGGNDLTIPAGATTFTFGTSVVAGGPYSVSVKTQPTAPAQVCTVASATGTANANTLVAVTCVTPSYTVGGTIAGLAGNGLTLLLNGASPVTPAAGATTFSFPALASGAPYAVTVSIHPSGPAQTCTVSSGTGTVGSANITNVVVTCATNDANTYTVGGTISGLTGTGLTLRLNGGAPLPLAPGATTFAFPAVAAGTVYTVSVGAQPGSPTQTCTITNGSGTVTTSNISNVAVACVTATFTVGGTVSGLTSNGLRLRLNGGAPLTVAAGATSFVFPAIASGTNYTVTVGQQPSAPTQSCTLANESGTIGATNVTNVTVTCVTVYTVGGTINNLGGSGLTLQLNGGTPLVLQPFTFNFSFAAVPNGTVYTITIAAQPTLPSQTCTITGGGTGTVNGANVTNVTLNCAYNGLTIGGTIAGYAGSGLALRLNGAPAMTIPGGRGKFVFPDFFNPGDEFSVTISAQPAAPTQTCTIIRAHGQVPSNPGMPIANIAIQCLTNATSPLSGTYAVLLGGARQFVTFWPDGTYTLATRVNDPSCGASNGNGVEYGVYNWNAATGAFTIRTGAVDTNGSCGIWDPTASPATGFNGTLTKAGATITLTDSDGPIVLTAVSSTPSTLIGSFTFSAGNDGSFVTFLSDGTYILVEVQAYQLAVGSVGFERGCYASTGSSFTPTLAAGCLPDGQSALDLNGVAGLSTAQGVPIPYVITGPNTITVDGDVLLVRLLPN